jgi:hypothetical protein
VFFSRENIPNVHTAWHGMYASRWKKLMMDKVRQFSPRVGGKKGRRKTTEKKLCVGGVGQTVLFGWIMSIDDFAILLNLTLFLFHYAAIFFSGPEKQRKKLYFETKKSTGSE